MSERLSPADTHPGEAPASSHWLPHGRGWGPRGTRPSPWGAGLVTGGTRVGVELTQQGGLCVLCKWRRGLYGPMQPELTPGAGERRQLGAPQSTPAVPSGSRSSHPLSSTWTEPNMPSRSLARRAHAQRHSRGQGAGSSAQIQTATGPPNPDAKPSSQGLRTWLWVETGL